MLQSAIHTNISIIWNPFITEHWPLIQCLHHLHLFSGMKRSKQQFHIYNLLNIPRVSKYKIHLKGIIYAFIVMTNWRCCLVHSFLYEDQRYESDNANILFLCHFCYNCHIVDTIVGHSKIVFGQQCVYLWRGI